MRLHLLCPHDHHRPITRHPIHDDKQQRRSGREQVRVRQDLRDVRDVRPVAVDIVRIVELEISLPHVHRVRREATAGEHNGRVGGSVIGRHASVGGRGDSEREGAAIAERLGDTHHLRTDARRKIRRVKYFGGICRGIGRVKLDNEVWIRPCNQHG